MRNVVRDEVAREPVFCLFVKDLSEMGYTIKAR